MGILSGFRAALRPAFFLLAAALALSPVSTGAETPKTAWRNPPADPAAVPLIKVRFDADGAMAEQIYLRILSVGGRKTDQPIQFDTGSSGMVIDCHAVLPAKYCSTRGLRIKKDTMIDGILVTTTTLKIRYGNHEDYGNLARAEISFGAADAPVRTAFPIWFVIRYKALNSRTRQLITSPSFPAGFFGVAPFGGLGPHGEAISPLAAVRVGPGMRRGYRLEPLGTDWKHCSTPRHGCPEVAALHVGLRDSDDRDFNFVPLGQTRTHHVFPTAYACVVYSGTRLCQPAVLDTGTVPVLLGLGRSGNTGKSAPKGAVITVTDENFGIWRFTTRYAQEVSVRQKLDITVIGIRFFEENAIALDIEGRRFGVRLAPLPP